MNKDMSERAKALVDAAIETRHPDSAYVRDFTFENMLVIQEALQSLSTPPEPSVEGMGDALSIVRNKIEECNSLLNSGVAKRHEIRRAKEELNEWRIISRALSDPAVTSALALAKGE